jgi:hypothetical protein
MRGNVLGGDNSARLYLAASLFIISLILPSTVNVFAQSALPTIVSTASDNNEVMSNKLSPSIIRIVDGDTFAQNKATLYSTTAPGAPSINDLNENNFQNPSSEASTPPQSFGTEIPPRSFGTEIPPRSFGTATAEPGTRLTILDTEIPPTEPPLIIRDAQELNPNEAQFAESNPEILNPEELGEVTQGIDPTKTLNPPFRLCQEDNQKLTFSNFATYTVVGQADFNDLVRGMEKDEKVSLQLLVDYDTFRIAGFMTVTDDKLKKVSDKPFVTPQGNTARDTVDEAGMIRPEISEFKPTLNTECERTVTGLGGSSFLSGDPNRLQVEQRAQVHLPFKTCETGGEEDNTISRSELKRAIWTIQGFDKIKEELSGIGGGKQPFNMQIYNDLLTGKIIGTLFIDPPNNGIIDLADDIDDSGKKIDFSPTIHGECYRTPAFNT